MKMAFHNKCILVIFSILYLFCNNSHCFNFTKVNGTWIVRQTSDSGEAKACPFIQVNTTSNGTLIVYQSRTTPVYNLRVNASKTNVHYVKDSKNATGNLTIHGGNLPFYIIASVGIKKENTTYFVLTGRLELPEMMEKNITKFLNDTPELKNVRFYFTDPKSLECEIFIRRTDRNASDPYPMVPPEMITTTMKPVITSMRPISTSRKPGKNAASGLSIANLVLIFTLLLVCNQ